MVVVLPAEEALRGDGFRTARIVADRQAVFGFDGLRESTVPAAFGGGLGVEEDLVGGLVDDEHFVVVHDVVHVLHVFPPCGGGHGDAGQLLLGRCAPEELLQLFPTGFRQPRRSAALAWCTSEIRVRESVVAQCRGEEVAGIGDLGGGGGVGELVGAVGEDVLGVGVDEGFIDFIDRGAAAGNPVVPQRGEADVLLGADVDGGSTGLGGPGCVVGVHTDDVDAVSVQNRDVPGDFAVGEVVAGGDDLYGAVLDGVTNGMGEEDQ
nr:hypothetical protein [Nocardia gipuzkoensis]